MANIANIVLNDGLSTPVAHTFTPDSTPNDGAVWLDRASPYIVGYNKLTMSKVRPKGPTGSARNHRVIVKIETPKLENVTNSTVSGIAPAPTVSYRPFAELHFVLPERCSEQDREDLRTYVYQLLNKDEVKSLVRKLEAPY